MKASSTMTIARRTVANVSSILSLCVILIVVLSGCEQAEQAEPPSQTTAQQQSQSSYPVIGKQTQTGQASQAGQAEGDSADLSFFGRIKAGDVAGVQAALEAGADPNTQDGNGLSALQLATVNKQSAIVEILLEKQPVLGVGETQPRSPQFQTLLLAARQGESATIQALLDQGIDINVKDPHSGRTALWSAAEQGRIEAVKMLLENRANPNIKGPRGFPPLVEVAAKGDMQVAELLLQHGANPNATEDINEWTALMTAVSRTDAEFVKLLVNHGADVNITDRNGKTAINFAYQINDKDTIAAIEAEPQSPSGLASAKKEPTGLILIPDPSEAQREKEQPEPPESPAAVAAAQPPDSEPLASAAGDSSAAAEAQKSKQVTQLLARAQKQFQQKNLTTPKGDNALDTCLEIFEIMPGHIDTAELVRKMEQQYRDWASTTKSAIRRKTYTEKAQELAALVQ